MKRAIRYLRFSQIGQSNGSIERQELYTDQWISHNKVELVDTFIDRGRSAKTFDRPDFIKLQKFIAKHYKTVDFLLVDQMDRFSRDAGEAMSLVKNLQKKYSIQVVSVSEGITFDYDTPGSFFRAGLQLLLAEEDNINRSIKIRGGLYTARAKEGRYVGTTAPFGYYKSGDGKDRRIYINEKEADLVKFIYDAYLKGMPLVEIKRIAHQRGFNKFAHTAIERVLASPVYAGMLEVKPFKDYPGGLFPAIHEPIIDKNTWYRVQEKMRKPIKERVVIDARMPLRGVLKCHCGRPLTGAPSRGKSGAYFLYYKCRDSKHNNISVKKAHKQLAEIYGLMSLPRKVINDVREGCYLALNNEISNSKVRLKELQKELSDNEESKFLLEEKWIKNQITQDTYQRWYNNYNNTINSLRSQIDKMGNNSLGTFATLEKNLDMLADMKLIYEISDVNEKRELVNMVFNGNLYYENGMYRTPTMMEIFSFNHLIMKEKGLLEFKKKRDDFTIIPSSGVGESRTPVQTSNQKAFYTFSS